jgi:hypothetical protein
MRAIIRPASARLLRSRAGRSFSRSLPPGDSGGYLVENVTGVTFHPFAADFSKFATGAV